MPAIGTMFGTEYGGITQRYIDFLVERARGGVGLIVTGNSCVDWPRGKVGGNPLRLDDDKFLAGFNELAEAVKLHGARLMTQLQFSGRLTNLVATEGIQPVAPSETPLSPGGERPRALTIQDIREIIEKFARAALLARKAGLDGIEVHGAHGYLPGQFLSPFTNRREDAYGGNGEGRARFCIELVGAIRSAVGSGFPIIYRMSADERMEGGLQLDESQWFASRLEEAGVDAFHVTAGIYETRNWMFPDMGMEKGCNVPLAEGIKKVVSVPVIAVGKITGPHMAEEILEQGQADLVAMARPLIADPDLPNKAKEGRVNEIRPCIYCNECIGRLYRNWRVRCTVNPYVGDEGKREAPFSAKKRRILVIGGGPGGMEVARVAAARGHKVTLCEKKDRLGGLLHLAGKPSFKADLRSLVDYYLRQISRTNITVKTKTRVTRGWLKNRRFDTIVVATGGIPLIPKFDNRSEKEILSVEKVLMGSSCTGKRVGVIGAGRVGCEVAEFLAEQGRKVILVEMLEEVAPDLHILGRERVLRQLEKLSVQVLTGVKVVEVNPKGLSVTDKRSQMGLIEVDSVVFAGGYGADEKTVQMLKGGGPEVFTIGDCKEPRSILDAITEGNRIGSLL